MTKEEFERVIKPLINKSGGYEEYNRIMRMLFVNYGLLSPEIHEWIAQELSKELDI